MGRICVYETTSLIDLLHDLSLLRKEWADKGIIVIRNSNPTEDQLIAFLEVFGPTVGVHWVNTPNHSITVTEKGPWGYKENHATAISGFGEVDKDTVLVPWHVEGLFHLRPQTAGAWIMRKFECPADSGTTGFIDMSRVWEYLLESKPDLADFATRSRFTSIEAIEGHEDQWKQNVSQGVDPFFIWYKPYYSNAAVEVSSITSQNVLRLSCNDGYLFSVDGEPPSEDHYKLAEQLSAFVHDICVQEPEDMTSWWHWGEGDLMLVDLFRMQHAVKGGFNEGDRILHGYWAF